MQMELEKANKCMYTTLNYVKYEAGSKPVFL